MRVRDRGSPPTEGQWGGGDGDDRALRRVLVAAYCPVPSATQDGMAVLSILRALHRHYAIDVVAVRGESQAHVERLHRSRVLRVPLSGSSEAERVDSFRRAVRRQIEAESYDVVHVRGPFEGLPVCELRESRAYKIVYELATFPAQDGSFGETARRDEMICLSTADVVVAGSEAARAHLYQRGVGDRVAVIPRGVDVDLFDWDFARPSTIATLAALGPFPKSRDVGTLLQAIAILLREHPVRLKLFGESDPARAEALEEKIGTLDLAETVEITRAVELEEVPSLIATSDVGIACAAPVERYMRAGDSVPGLLEFMACRKPVVAARVPSIRDVFADRRELLLYEPGDPESLADAVLGLLRSGARRDTMAQAGYRRVRDDFPASASRRRLLGVYRTLADPTIERTAPPPTRTPTPISLVAVDTAIVSSVAADAEYLPAAISGDTSPGLAGADGRSDTDPEIRLRRARAAAATDHTPSDTTAEAWPTDLGGSIRAIPGTSSGDVPTGESELPELPRETTRSVVAPLVDSGVSDLAEEVTRSGSSHSTDEHADPTDFVGPPPALDLYVAAPTPSPAPPILAGPPPAAEPAALSTPPGGPAPGGPQEPPAAETPGPSVIEAAPIPVREPASPTTSRATPAPRRASTAPPPSGAARPGATAPRRRSRPVLSPPPAAPPPRRPMIPGEAGGEASGGERRSSAPPAPPVRPRSNPRMEPPPAPFASEPTKRAPSAAPPAPASSEATAPVATETILELDEQDLATSRPRPPAK